MKAEIHRAGAPDEPGSLPTRARALTLSSQATEGTGPRLTSTDVAALIRLARLASLLDAGQAPDVALLALAQRGTLRTPNEP